MPSKKTIALIIIIAIAIGVGILVWTQYKIKSEPLVFSMAGVSASVSKTNAPFNYTADQLKAMAEECGTKHATGYFDELTAKFSLVKKTVYTFKYQGDGQGDGLYTVTLLPNKAEYISLDQFKKDFDLCFAGGDAYPTMLNNNWLLFVNSCGTGFDDGSGRPYGCDEIKKIVEPSLKLN
jgi:hypothetical protein